MLISVELEKSFKVSMSGLSLEYCRFEFKHLNELNNLFLPLYFEGVVLRKNEYIFHHKLIRYQRFNTSILAL